MQNHMKNHSLQVEEGGETEGPRGVMGRGRKHKAAPARPQKSWALKGPLVWKV